MKAKFLFLFLSVLFLFSSCESTPEAQIEQELKSTKQLVSFTLEKSNNESYLEQDIVGTIDNETIKLTISETVNTTQLVATFTHNGEAVYISSKPQVSGITVNDFTKSIAYTIEAEDGSKSVYTVSITWLPKEVVQIPQIYINTKGGTNPCSSI